MDSSTLEAAAAAACRAGLRAGLPEADARDLAQEALVRALTSARPPEGVALTAWVYGIARNLRRDHAKAGRRREVGVDADELGARAGDADETSLATVLAVRRAVDELPEPLRAVVALHELEELSLRETAQVLEIPFDTAKDRLRRARAQLRETLGASADTDPVVVERSYARRRALVHASAIGAAVAAMLGGAGTAMAGTSATAGAQGNADAAPFAERAVTRRGLRPWSAAAVVAVSLGAGFAVGRSTAPSVAVVTLPPAAVPVAVVATAPPLDASVSVPLATDAGGEEAAPPQSAGRPAPRSARPAPAPAPAAPAPPDGTEEAPELVEQRLLDRARVGLRRGLADEALVTLMEHARRFPQGAHAEERDVLIIEAYLDQGNVSLAERRIAAYRATYPDGILRRRVDALASERR